MKLDSDQVESEKLAEGAVVEIRLGETNNDPLSNDQGQVQVVDFQRAVTLGDWQQLKSLLGKLDSDPEAKVYQHILQSLAAPVVPAPPDADPTQPVPAQPPNPNEQPAFSFLTPDDVLGLIHAAPHDLNESNLESLAQLLGRTHTQGHSCLQLIESLNNSDSLGPNSAEGRLKSAQLLIGAGLLDEVEAFLPDLQLEQTQSDHQALKLWSRLAIAMHAKTRVLKWLEFAWASNQSLLALAECPPAERELALQNLLELAPQVDSAKGQQWLLDSFSKNTNRGMKIIAQLGTKSFEQSKLAASVPAEERLKLLQLQHSAVKALIESAPEAAQQWSDILTLLAQNWVDEANTAIQNSRQNSRQPYMQIDMYGNYYWMDPQQMAQMRGGMPRVRPIKIGDLLVISPTEWMQLIHEDLHLLLHKSIAVMHLRINEEDLAFPYIEKIAPAHPAIARELVHEFLGIWTRNHDPNTDKRQRNPYIYFYGFDQKAEAIPLTRSKQERNLKELTQWVARIRALPIDDVDEKKLADAFTTCHSTAEVFELDRVRSVFGELGALEPETVAAISQKMRANLATSWRDVRTQEEKKTRRSEVEVQEEVVRGYGVARSLVAEALESHPENWQLHLAMACLMFDENAYSQTIQKSSEFSDRRDLAFTQFVTAADKYQDIAATLDQSEQSTEVYDFWFYASLGAVDLARIDNETVPDLKQYARIRAAIQALPGGLAEDHLGRFANNLFTRMNPVKPEIKFRYLRGGFEIVGDHPRAWEAKNLYEYYRDLVNEIQLVVEIDGPDRVGHESPFGIYVNILHTVEIERESGGFGKYVQNQNSQMFAYNYGRPTEDYRDKFEQAVNQALSEHFDVLNVTFEGEKSIRSRPAGKAGWRVTPYAYILLKSRGPEVDRIPSLKLDLDFLDTSGYAVIPIESPDKIIDSLTEAAMRPAAEIDITQTLDERRADDGKLILEVSATAKGLVPDLDKLLELERDNFKVINIDDQGVLPTRFESEGNDIQIISDRSWTVEYQSSGNGRGQTANAFEFPPVRIEAGNRFQRYEDADLVEVSQSIQLERNYASNSGRWLRWFAPLFLLFTAAAVIAWVITRQKPAPPTHDFEIPAEVNPFTVLTLLNSIKSRNGISGGELKDLQTSINRIEQVYFSESSDEQLDSELGDIARTWVQRTRRNAELN